MYQTGGVVNIHELHVWAISSDKISLTAHVVINPTYDYEAVIKMLREVLILKFNISHTTLQAERSSCLAEGRGCHFI